MNNKERLENILKIRSIRNKIELLNLNLEEKEILKRSLNYLEDDLNLEIIVSNRNIDELMDENIDHDEKVNVPIEENSNRNHEYAVIDELNLNNIIDNLYNQIDSLELDSIEQFVILKSLQSYCTYLEQVKNMKQSGNAIYQEEFGKSK